MTDFFGRFVEDVAEGYLSDDAASEASGRTETSAKSPRPRVSGFAVGTKIVTHRGEKSIEDLLIGDRVFTRDNGLQSVLWIGETAPAAANVAIVEIKAGALGNGLPENDLNIAVHHRVLLQSELALLMFDQREVFVEARHLVGLAGISQASVQASASECRVILLAQHEVIMANGAWAESFHFSPQNLSQLDQSQVTEIKSLFIDLDHQVAARRALKGHEVRKFAALKLG
jgi:hypothetical protein